MVIKIQYLNNRAKIPTQGSSYAAGFDLYCASQNDIVIFPEACEKISTGLAIECPHGYFGAVFARSGLATRQGLRPANCVAVIDEDYRGEWIIPLYNDSTDAQIVHPGDRIAQVVFLPYLQSSFEVVDNLSETARGKSGFGSTGK